MKKTGLLILVMAALGAAPPAGADGMLDPGFGNGGLVVTAFPGAFSGDIALSLVVLPDGRAVAAGSTNVNLPTTHMAVARYLTTGALDTTFDGDGLVTVPFVPPPPGPDTFSEARAVLPQADGRLVLVGSAAAFQATVFAVARLNADGSLDSAFGTGGRVTTPFPGSAQAQAGVLQADGRIVAVGMIGSGSSIAAARYNGDGSLDPTFGTGGTLIVPLPGPFDIRDAALQADGKLVIAGTRPSSPFLSRDFALVRLLPSGALDVSFSGDGLATTDFGGIETGHSVIVLDDGRLVLAGSRGTALPNIVTDFALARYLPDGTLDTTFGTAGLALIDSGEPEYPGQVVQLPNGNLLVAGSTSNQGAPVDFLLARLLPNGSLDSSFGTGGFLRTDFATNADECHAVAIAGPDRLLVAGSTGGFPLDVALARYIATTPVDLRTFSVE
jgi:uncharacterized delta-60 repeat protein